MKDSLDYLMISPNRQGEPERVRMATHGPKTSGEWDIDLNWWEKLLVRLVISSIVKRTTRP